MRILGLDVGEKRIGVAISDELGIIASGFDVIKRENDGKDIDSLCDIVLKYKVNEIVVGFPKNMNGTIGPSGFAVKGFVEEFRRKSNVKIKLWDERLTTVAAERTLLEADMSRKKRRKVIDKLAAVLILQGYLDSKRT